MEVGTGGVQFSYAPAGFSFGLGLAADVQVTTTADDLLNSLVKEGEREENGPQVLRTRVGGDATEELQGAGVQGDASQQPEDDSNPGEFIEMLPLAAEVAGKIKQGATPATPGGGEVAALSAEEIAELGRRPYWMRTCRHIKSPFLRLHQEIIELVELLQPTDEEVSNRRGAVLELTSAVNAIWPAAEVQVFGSFSTGLFVPTSDVDVVITESGCTEIQSGLRALGNTLMRKQVAKTVQVIAKAKVPIVKFETAGYNGLSFDVSFDVANGPEAAVLVRELTGAWPMMRPLVLVLKLFLQQRELNEVYTGGIGSYALITMVAAFLQLHTSRKPKAPAAGSTSSSSKSKGASLLEPGLGVLLVDFFRLYGRVLNTNEVGITASGGGRFFRKDGQPGGGWVNYERPGLLAVEDPKDPTNDVCRNSYNVRLVKAAFDFAYQQLTAPASPDESLLARILRLGAILASRRPPSNPRQLYTQPIPTWSGQEPRQQPQGDGKERERKRQRTASPSANGSGKASGSKRALDGAAEGEKGGKRRKQQE